ncbi:MAG: glycosyltransferase family 1 protein [Pseudomonas sp.]|nr:MAG: glycosyltransferase family 1 protein [Pseudomonas sp.]
MSTLALLTSEFAPFSGGVGTYARELAVAAQHAGHQVTVLAPDYGSDQSALDATFPFRVIRYAGNTADMKSLPTRVQVTRRLLMRERFDVVHAIDWPFFIPVALAPRHGAHTLLTVHGTEIIYMQEVKRRLMLRLIGFWSKGWASWIGNSQYTTDLLLRAFPQIDTADVRAIPLAVGDDWRERRVPRHVARGRWGLTSNDLVIVSLGRVVPRKGHLDLAEALSQLPECLTKRVCWWVIGPLNEPAHAELLRARASALPFDVTFFGGLDAEEVASRLSSADLFCLPGYQDEQGRVEGFGLVFLEAAAFGVPSVATHSGGIPEAISDGETGILVPERDPAALADALTRVLADDRLRGQLAAGAEARAAAATWAHVAHETYGNN